MNHALDPTLTVRHGFVLSEGNRVNQIADDSTFIVSKVVTLSTSPVVLFLDDSKGGFVDASVVMISEDGKRNRATFCEVCFNHYTGGVCWFKHQGIISLSEARVCIFIMPGLSFKDRPLFNSRQSHVGRPRNCLDTPVMHGLICDSGGVGAFGGWYGSSVCGGGSGELVTEAVFVG